MTSLEALTAHLDARPPLPRPVPEVGSKAWIEWRKAMDRWIATKESIEAAATVGKTEFKRPSPRCTPKADDYYYRGPMPRKRRAA